MTYKVGYLLKADNGIYNVIREAMPGNCELVTTGEARTPMAVMPELDFVIAGRLTAEMITGAPDLKMILAPGIGTDGIDLVAAAERGIPVACTVCGNVEEVAEHALLLMLAVSRRLVELDNALRAGEWAMWSRRLQCRNLSGRTLGIVGFGRIGQEIARRAAAFRMQVVYHDLVPVPEWRYMSLDDLLESSDYVSLNLPLTRSTRGFLNRERIAKLRQGSVLINTARGELVDEPALIEALRTGHLSGAGLDVFSPEPPSGDNELLKMPQVVVTPHVASGTLDGLRAKAEQYADNIRRFLAGADLIDGLQPVKGV